MTGQEPRWGWMTIALLVVAFALSTGFIWAKQGMMLHTFVAAFVAWWGYLFAHYFATGVFLDGLEDTGHLEEHGERLVVAVIGVAVLVLGFVVGAIGISGELFGVTFLAAVLFLAGYVITHHAVTRVPL